MRDDEQGPASIGDYRVVHVLGRGGMGTVYLAHDGLLARQVAVKVIDGYRDHPAARARFLVEARAIARLNHPNVVTVHRAGEHDGEPYLVSEYVDGTPLDRLPRPITPARAMAIATGLTRGLAAAHRHGILHRDVKPSNAMVAADGTIKLLDFGLAKLAGAPPIERFALGTGVGSPGRLRRADPDATPTFGPAQAPPPTAVAGADELTAAGSRLGTPRYMSPEAWRGERLTAASDVFSLGLVLWELFAGRHPWGEVRTDGAARGVPSLHTVAGAAPSAVVAVIDRALRVEPGARFADAGAMLVALEAALDPAGGRGTWVAVGAVGFAALATAGLAALLAAPGPARPRPRPSSAAPAPLEAAAVAPRALTLLGGCAELPAFLDEATIAFGFRAGEVAEVRTVVSPGASTTLVERPRAWDTAPTAGRRPGEALYITDGADGWSRLMARARSVGLDAELAIADTAAAADGVVYLASARDPHTIRRLDGAGERPLVTVDGPIADLVVSPDGSRLAVVLADRSTLPRLCLVDVASRDVRCPSTTWMQVGRPAFNRTGTRLYYPAREGLRVLDLALFDAGDEGHDRLVSGAIAPRGGLAISPDGYRLVYSTCRTWGSIYAFDRGALTQVVDESLVRNPAVSPTGDLAYVGRVEGGGTRLVVRDRRRNESRTITSAPGELGQAAFSADGRRVAYGYAPQGQRSRIVVAPLDGDSPQAWTQGEDDRRPLWLGDELIFTRLRDGRPSVWRQRDPAGPARPLVAGWLAHDLVDGRVLVGDGRERLAWLEPAGGALTAISTRGLGGQGIGSARVLPDGALALTLPDASAVVRLDPVTGAVERLHQFPLSETLGESTVLPDGRVALRVEQWLGELYQLDGDW